MEDGLTRQDTSFSEMGVNNIELGVALHRYLGLNSIENQQPDNMNKVREISEFFNDHPEAVGTLERVARSNKNPNIKNVDHLLSFVSLSKEKFSLLNKIDDLNKQLKFYE